MNKYNEFFAYIENKRMREDNNLQPYENNLKNLKDTLENFSKNKNQVKKYLTLMDLNLFEGLDINGPLSDKNLNGKNFYTLIYNFNEYINTINIYLKKWKNFEFGIKYTKEYLNKLLNNPIIMALNQAGGDSWLSPLTSENLIEAYIKTKEISSLNHDIIIAASLKEKSSNKSDGKYFLFKVKNIPGYSAFNTYGKNLDLTGLLSIFEPISGRDNSYQSNFINAPESKNNIQITINDFKQFIKNILNGFNENDKYSKENKNNTSSGMNELQAKAASGIIINVAKNTIKEEKLSIQYNNLFERNEKKMKSASIPYDKWNDKLKKTAEEWDNNIKKIKMDKNLSYQLLYMGCKPIQFQEKSYKVNINSINSKEIGSELVECYFNFYLSLNNNARKEWLENELVKSSYYVYLNSFEDFSKVFFQKLIGNLQNNKTTINDNNIIYTLGFKQGNYFKMENPLSCKFSIIVGKDVGRQSKLTNVVNFINNTSQKNPNSALYTNNRVVNMR